MLAATSAVAGAAANNVGEVISGTSLAMRPNVHTAKFSKVRTVKGKRKDNLIWVNSLFLYLMVYVPPGFYDFVWNHLKQHCVNARIIELQSL